jgi:hypothetical protein
MLQYVDDSTFMLYAAKHYDNPVCRDDEEFLEDVARIRNLQRLFGRYMKTGELKERLILNHLIVLYNVFQGEACTAMLAHKLRIYLPYLKPFLVLLSRWPERIDSVKPEILGSDIPMDENIVNTLRKI